MIDTDKLGILLISETHEDVEPMSETLLSSGACHVELLGVREVEDALTGLNEGKTDVILLVLSLSHVRILSIVESIRQSARWVPLVVVADADEEEFSLSVLRAGAQEYLGNREIDGPELMRTLRRAVERINVQRTSGGPVSIADPDKEHNPLQGLRSTQSGADPTVLIVDDDPTILKMASRVLAEEGYRIVSVNRPEEALQAAAVEKKPIDLLLSDVAMPRLNGCELYDKLLELYPDLQVVFMSGFYEDLTSFEIEATDGKPLIRKPFKIEHLKSVVRNALQQSS